MTAALLDCVEINPESDPAYVVIGLHGLGADGPDIKVHASPGQLPAN